ncbi:MAG: UDP-N-acetylmuramyl pentapeptide phosphotransferase, partial [Syntrophobacter sp.]
MAAFGLFFSSVLLGAAGAWVVGRVADKTGFLDYPNERSSHRTPTPRGGGIGIFVAFLLSASVTGAPLTFHVPIGIVSIIALCGDRVPLSPVLRLYCQLFLVLFLVAGMGIPAADSRYYPALVLFWTVFIVGTANLCNFMDGIDGNAAIAGIVGFGLLALYLLAREAQGYPFITAVCVALACLGFLPFNMMPRAKVFMGDVGSILIGSVYAGLVYVTSCTFTDFACMVSFLFPAYADGLTTMYIRLRDGENLTHSHRRHIHQLLANEGGIPHWKISLA